MWKLILILVMVAIGGVSYYSYKKQINEKATRSSSRSFGAVITLIIFSILFLALGVLCFVGQNKSIIGGVFGILGAIFFGYIAYQSYRESK